MAYVLAQYTIRSKQEYIFRSNRIAEIIGASDNITVSWDILLDQAKKVLNNKIQQIRPQEQFNMPEVKKAFEAKQLHMVELFRGGGNETVLYDSFDSYREVNGAFSYYLLCNYPGLIPMAVCCEYTGDYQHDYACLLQVGDRE